MRSFLINWLLARQNGWKVVLRIDDLDGPRKKPGAVEQILDIMEWIGMDWDEGPLFQSSHMDKYLDAVEQLNNQGLIYACHCTRTEIQNATISAPHGHEIWYPGTCQDKRIAQFDRSFASARLEVTQRPADQLEPNSSDSAATDNSVDTRKLGWRVRATDQWIEFEDQFCGPQKFNVAKEVGDFLVLTRGGAPSYQLSVVVDDWISGITEVVRGDDLLNSTTRQIYLYRLLGIEPEPNYFHLPLIIGTDGRRLAKRHGDTRVSLFREQGATAQHMLGLMGNWCGVENDGALSIEELMNRFRLEDLSPDPVVYSKAEVMKQLKIN